MHIHRVSKKRLTFGML